MKKQKRDKRAEALINIFDGKIDDLIFWSFRYFLGRMTIATDCFARDLVKAWDLLSDRIKELIGKELEEAFEDDDKARADKKNKYKIYPLGHDCDRESWQLVREKYKKNE